MYTKKPKEMGSKLMICGLVYCLNEFQKPTITAKAYLALFQFVVYYKRTLKQFVSEAAVEQTKILFSRIHVASVF